jgi:hypothetical protein
MGDSIGYGIAGMGFIVSAISLIIIITFFVMASRLLSIKNTLKKLLDLELIKPENQVNCTCEKCQEVYGVSKLWKGKLVKCPKCKEPNRVP